MENRQIKRREPGANDPEAALSTTQTSSNSADNEKSNHNNVPKEQAAISRRDTASYIHDMTTELKKLAETANFPFLAYLLELAIEESAAQKRERL